MNSEDRGLRRTESLKSANMPTTNHLLVIGIDAYTNGLNSLNNAVRDAKAFEVLLKEKYNFKEENITTLYDEKATADSIIEAFDHLIQNLTEDDNLVFYFSGHGELEQKTNRGYWIPVEGRSGRRASYLNNAEIKDFVRVCKARHVLGIVDACFSGSLLRNMNRIQLEKYFSKPSRRVMTSGLIEPVSDGPSGQHSPFAAALLSALRYNPKAYLSASALWQEMQEGLDANTNATPQFQVLGDVNHQGGEFFFLATEFDDIPKVEIAISTDEGVLKGGGQNEKETIASPPPKPKTDISKLPFPEWKVALKKLAITDLERAMDEVEKRIDTSSKAYNSLILLMSQRHAAQKAKNLTATAEQSRISFARLRISFNGFIDDLDEAYDMKK